MLLAPGLRLLCTIAGRLALPLWPGASTSVAWQNGSVMRDAPCKIKCPIVHDKERSAAPHQYARYPRSLRSARAALPQAGRLFWLGGISRLTARKSRNAAGHCALYKARFNNRRPQMQCW